MDFRLRQTAQPRPSGPNGSYPRVEAPRPSSGTVEELLKASAKQHIGDNGQQRGIKKGNSLSRYKKNVVKGKAPKGQFKKYMEEATNVFYSERPQLKQLERYSTIKLTCFLVWLFLTVTYFAIGTIDKYSGFCPKLARCNVFVRCPEYFELSESGRECVLSSTAVDEIKWFAISEIENLQLDYGDRQCAGDDSVPEMDTDELLQELATRQHGSEFMKKAYEFFGSAANEKEFNFEFNGRKVRPTVKRYSLGCYIRMSFFSLNFWINLFYLTAGLGVVGYVWNWWRENRRYSQIYAFLKERLMAESDRVLNITLTLPELEKKFGTINEGIWDKVNDVRAAEKQIGFYEDDFLYWKLAV